MFIFKYSKRPNTPALQYEDHIPEEEKTRRLHDCAGAAAGDPDPPQREVCRQVEEVHVEGYNKATGQWIGRTSQNKTLNFHARCRSDAGESLLGTVSACARHARRRRTRLAGESIARVRCRAVNLIEGDGATMEVEMKIRGLMMDPVTNMPIVVLKDINGNTVLPIWVGIFEANAIALEIEKVSTPRPMTHDLIKTVLLGLDTRMKRLW